MRQFIQLLRHTAYAVAPQFTASLDESLWLRKKATELLRATPACETSIDYLDVLEHNCAFVPLQIRSEIVRFLDLIEQRQPCRICEIGAASGGTLFLFANVITPPPFVVSVDTSFGSTKRHVFPRFAKSGGNIVCVEGDSQCETTRNRVQAAFGGQSIDVLFIDGDHSLGGVSRDYELYAPLVRPGGVIAFHDIVPDYHTRFGRDTSTNTGDVPVFWSRIMQQCTATMEIIQDKGQDGYGIGILFV